jgi:hypothetical protein
MVELPVMHEVGHYVFFQDSHGGGRLHGARGHAGVFINGVRNVAVAPGVQGIVVIHEVYLSPESRQQILLCLVQAVAGAAEKVGEYVY